MGVPPHGLLFHPPGKVTHVGVPPHGLLSLGGGKVTHVGVPPHGSLSLGGGKVTHVGVPPHGSLFQGGGKVTHVGVSPHGSLMKVGKELRGWDSRPTLNIAQQEHFSGGARADFPSSFRSSNAAACYPSPLKRMRAGWPPQGPDPRMRRPVN